MGPFDGGAALFLGLGTRASLGELVRFLESGKARLQIVHLLSRERHDVWWLFVVRNGARRRVVEEMVDLAVL